MANTMTDAERIEQLEYGLRDVDILRMEALSGMMEARAIISLFLDGKIDRYRLEKLKDSLSKKIHEPYIPFEQIDWIYDEAGERLSYGRAIHKGKAELILVGDKVQDDEGNIGKVLNVYREESETVSCYTSIYIRVQMEGQEEPINIKLTEVEKVE